MRVAIVNDVPLTTEALRRIVLSDPRHQIAWMAADGEEAVRLCKGDRPDVVLMDLVMPRINGAEATRRIMQQSPCAILVVTAGVATNYHLVCEALGHGAFDAVSTPVLGSRSAAEAGAELLGKLSAVDRINRRITQMHLALPAVSKPAAPPLPPGALVPLVALGTSTGGPLALAAVLGALPADFPGAVLVVQHIGPEYAGCLVDWLRARTPLTVRAAKAGDLPEAGTVLIASSADHMVLTADRTLSYVREPSDYPYRPSVNVLFQSLARNWPAPGLAALLTGIGRDGAQGLLTLLEAGWRTIAQDQATSVVFGMPRAAIDLAAASHVLPLDQIGPFLCKYLRPSPAKSK
jgi:two-component system response regulator WspF